MTEKEKLQQRINELIEMTDAFCKEKINEEYAELCKKMIEKLGRKRSVKPLATGRLNIWAATIVYTIAINNFLFDRNSKPYLPASEIHDYFDTKQSTVTGKAAQVRQILKMSTHFDPEYSTQDRLKDNPLLGFSLLGGILRF